MDLGLEQYLNERLDRFRREELVPIQKALSQLEGTTSFLSVQTAANHAENTQKLDMLISRFDNYVGSVEGAETWSERKTHALREWLKVILSALSLSALANWIRIWWNSWHK